MGDVGDMGGACAGGVIEVEVDGDGDGDGSSDGSKVLVET